MSQQKVCALSILLLLSNVSLWAMDRACSMLLNLGSHLHNGSTQIAGREALHRAGNHAILSVGAPVPRSLDAEGLMQQEDLEERPQEKKLDQRDQLESARFDWFGHLKQYPLHDIACEVNEAKLERSLDQMLWLLKKEEDSAKKDDQGKTCVDYLNLKKISRGEIESHLAYLYYFEPTTDMVIRSGSFRWTYPQGLRLQKPEPVFCDCLESPQQEGVIYADVVPESVVSVHPAHVVLKCSELQKDPAYVAWKKVLANLEHVSEDQRETLAKKWKPLQKDWHTFRIAQTLCNESGARLFQFALLQDDYDLVSYLLQHKLVTSETISWVRQNTFFARTVPMLELLEQYGILTLTDKQQNNPFHHFAKHGRLLYATVIDYYLQKGVDPLARNASGFTPLDLLVQYSYRFDGYESKLQAFVDMLLQKGAYTKDQRIQFRGDLLVLGILLRGGIYSEDGQNIQCTDTLLEIAQKTHAVWNLPATKLVVEALAAQERKDASYAQFLKFRTAFAITYPRVEGDTPLHTVVKMLLQKHDRLTEFVPSFKDMGFEERLAFFQCEFETIEILLRQGYDFAAQNSLGRTIFHELCADWHLGTKQRAILYRKLLRSIFTSQTKLKEYHDTRIGRFDICPPDAFEEMPDIRLMSERLQKVLALKDNQGVSVLDMSCNDKKPCAHEEYWCVGDLLLGTTPTFKNRLISFLQYKYPVEMHEDYKWVLGLYESFKKNNEC